MAIEKVYGLLKLDINPNNTIGEQQTVAIQGDYNSRYITIELWNGKSRYTYSNSAEIRINFHKGNKSFMFSSFQSNSVIERRNGNIIVRIPLDVAEEKGNWKASVNIIDGNSKVSTQPFILIIEQTLSGGDTSLESEAVDLINDALSRVDTSLVNVNTALNQLGETPSRVTALENRVDNIKDELDDFEAKIDYTKFGLYQDPLTKMLYATYDGQYNTALGVYIKSTGGGGGGSSSVTDLTIVNLSGVLTTISKGNVFNLKFQWYSYMSGTQTGDGFLTVKVGKDESSLKEVTTTKVSQGNVSIPLTSYLADGNNVIQYYVTDSQSVESQKLMTKVNVASLVLESSFSDNNFITDDLNSRLFLYTAKGDFEKHMYFEIDGVAYSDFIVSSSTEQQFTIPKLSHGVHYLRVYYKANINGDAESPSLEYTLMYTKSGDSTVIIAPIKSSISTVQYANTNVYYKIYNPRLKTNLTVKAINSSGAVITTKTFANVDNILKNEDAKPFSFTPKDKGEVTVVFEAEGVSKSVKVNVEKSDVDVSAYNYFLDMVLSTYGRDNNETGKEEWKDEEHNISATLTGFNYQTDGWVDDANGDRCLRVTGDARVTIPFQIFENDISANGKTIEIDFATSEVLDYESPIISCWDETYSGSYETTDENNVATVHSFNGKGLRITPQYVEFNSQLNPVKIQFKEDEHIRVSIVIEGTNDSSKRLAFVYLNAVMSAAYIVDNNDRYDLDVTRYINIGSSYCTTDIYGIRVYSKSLSSRNIVDNWIADTQDGVLRKERYDRNNVYDNYGNVSIEKLPSYLPYMVLNYKYDAERVPTSKKDTQHADVKYRNPDEPKRDFDFEYAETAVQGTSSETYYKKNLKIKYKSVSNSQYNTKFKYNDGTTSSKYKLRDDSIPVNVFTYKADVASSEGANNVELVGLYNDAFPFETPGQKRVRLATDGASKGRLGIDGIPIVTFVTLNGNTKFYSKMNFNNDKSNSDIFGLAEGDEYWQVEKNTTGLCLFRDTDGDWGEEFSGEYPKDNTDYTRIQAVVRWIASTCTDDDRVTNNPLSAPVTYDGVEYTTDSKEYRLAKFKNELSEWFEIDNCSYYFAFVDLFLMVDSFAKNSIIVFFKDDTKPHGGKYYWYAYDMDTALGIDNEGQTPDERDYYCEWGDSPLPSGNPAYNGESSVFWRNFYACFKDKIKDMYVSLRNGSYINYEEVERRFETHQSVWSEAIFNEDSQVKCIEPYRDKASSDDSRFIPMLHGSKETQRKWWLYNRFKYFDSKYLVSVADDDSEDSDIIPIRHLNSGELKIKSYSDIYISLNNDGTIKQQRKRRGQEATFQITNEMIGSSTNKTDAVLTLYSASQLSEINGLENLKVKTIGLGRAVKLKTMKLGGENINTSLTSVTFGSNRLLKTIDLTNCANLGTESTQTTLNVSNCANLEEYYGKGTSLQSVSFPTGGNLKKIKLSKATKIFTLENHNAIEELTIGDYNINGTSSLNYADLSLLETIRIKDSKVNTQKLLTDYFANFTSSATGKNLSRLTIIGLDWSFETEEAFETFLAKLNGIKGADAESKAVLQGTVHIPFAYTSTINKIHETYPLLDIVSPNLDKVTVRFLQGENVIFSKIIPLGGNLECTGTIVCGENEKFIGWVDETKTIQSAKNVQADLDLFAEIVNLNNEVNAGTNVYYYKSGDEIVIYGNGNIEESFSQLYLINNSFSKLRIQEGIVEIGSNSFKDKTNIQTVVLSSSVRKINTNVFYGCTGLTNVYSNDNIVSIGQSTFQSCTSLEEFKLPDNSSFTTISNSLFKDCSSLETVKFNKYVRIVGQDAFRNCSSMENIEFSPAITTINSYAFYNSGLKEVTLGTNLTTLSKSAFENNSNLKNVTILNSLERIPENCFANCGIEYLDIASSVNDIREYAFYGCNNMKKAIVRSVNCTISIFAFAKESLGSTSYYYFPNCTAESVGSNVTSSIGISSATFIRFSTYNPEGKIYFKNEETAELMKQCTNWYNYKDYISYEV